MDKKLVILLVISLILILNLVTIINIVVINEFLKSENTENQNLPKILEGEAKKTIYQASKPIAKEEAHEASKPIEEVEFELIKTSKQTSMNQRDSGGSSSTEEPAQPPEQIFLPLPETTNITIITIESKTVSVDETFDVSVDIDAISEAYAVQFELYFNPNILNAIDLIEGDFFRQNETSTYPVTKINNTLGKIEFASTRLGIQSGANGYGRLAKITFNSMSKGTTTIDLQNVALVDANIESISVSDADGIVNVL